MSQMTDSNSTKGLRNRGCLFALFWIAAAFLGILAVLAVVVVTTINRAETAVQPVSDLVRQLFVPATPVILPSSTIIVHQINDLARLETASVNLEKIITAERNNDVLWGALGETLIFVAHGKVVAGVDFAAMSEGDIQVASPTEVWIHLPDAQVFADLPVLDNQNSYVAHRDTGLLASSDPQLETQVRQQAEAVIREEALGTGLIEQANLNAENYMRNFLLGLGFVEIKFFDETPPTPLPFEPEIPKGFVTTTPVP